jgi:hypothetical protein
MICFEHFNSSILLFLKSMFFLLKPQVALNELELDSTNIMCSLIINKHINCLNQYELLSLKYSTWSCIKILSTHSLDTMDTHIYDNE